jgi:molecular chaperone Hsp33
MLVVDYRTPGNVRALARFDKEQVAAAIAAGRADPGRLIGHGHLAMTIDQGPDTARYQGLVALEGKDLEHAAHEYFLRSEQIPTRVRLAVAEMFDRDAEGAARRSWRAGGIIGQFLPDAPERLRRHDLPAGDVPEGQSVVPEVADDDAWVEAQTLIDTVEDHELTDPSIAAERLLFRLFHERGVRVFDPIAMEEKCSCSREKISQVLDQLEPQDGAAETSVEVRCEFCGKYYHFGPDEPDAGTSGQDSDSGHQAAEG